MREILFKKKWRDNEKSIDITWRKDWNTPEEQLNI